MVKPLEELGYVVLASDISDKHPMDFLTATKLGGRVKTILTNPPYDKLIVDKFILNALELTRKRKGMVCMLLRVEFDAAISRRVLFEEHPAFRMKIILHRRLKIPGFKHRASPTKHHAWYVWDWSTDNKVKELRYA